MRMGHDLGGVHRWCGLLVMGCLCLGEPVFAQPAVQAELAELHQASAAAKNSVDALTDFSKLIGRGAAGPPPSTGLSLVRQGASHFAPSVLNRQLERVTRAVTNVTVPPLDAELGKLFPAHRVPALLADRATTRHDAFAALLTGLRSLHRQKRRMQERQTELDLLQRRIDVASDAARELVDSLLPLTQAPMLGVREIATATVGYFLLDLPDRLARAEREITTKQRQLKLFVDHFESDGFANLLGNLKSYLAFDRATIDVADAAALQRNGDLVTALSQLDWGRPNHSYRADESASAIAYNRRSAANVRRGARRVSGGSSGLSAVPAVDVTSIVEVSAPASGVTPYEFTPAEQHDRAIHEARREAHDNYRREWKRDAARAARELREAMGRSRPPASDPPDSPPVPPQQAPPSRTPPSEPPPSEPQPSEPQPRLPTLP